ncbi:MAG TPA: hypothetical protein VH912_33045 [Streptosporangiaceae bacterium]|jgi:hypothetical protein
MGSKEMCEALFVSFMPSDVTPDGRAVADAVRWAVDQYHGIRGCAAEMAAAYGNDPDSAVARMRWARGVVASLSTLTAA